VTAGSVCWGELSKLEEFEAERLDARDEPVQRGTVDDRTYQQCLGALVSRLERIQGDLQRRRQPTLDPEGVVGRHLDLRSRTIAHPPSSERRGERVSRPRHE
jgi:hypothetical protein